MDEEPEDLEEPEEPEPPGSAGRKRGLLLAGLGAFLIAAGLLVSPNAVLETRGAPEGRHGLPVWSLGIFLLAAGAWELALARSPALAERMRERPILRLLVGLGVLALIGFLVWR